MGRRVGQVLRDKAKWRENDEKRLRDLLYHKKRRDANKELFESKRKAYFKKMAKFFNLKCVKCGRVLAYMPRRKRRLCVKCWRKVCSKLMRLGVYGRGRKMTSEWIYSRNGRFVPVTRTTSLKTTKMTASGRMSLPKREIEA